MVSEEEVKNVIFSMGPSKLKGQMASPHLSSRSSGRSLNEI